MAESIMLDKAKDFAVEIINLCKDIKNKKRKVSTNGTDENMGDEV